MHDDCGDLGKKSFEVDADLFSENIKESSFDFDFDFDAELIVRESDADR